MSSAPGKALSIFAPAKINLFLHITGKRHDGYHLLDSLVAFADVGDQIVITPADEFSFEVSGPYAKAFDAHSLDAGKNSANLVVQAAWMMARLFKKPLNVKAHLVKNLPLGAGLGGGSSDAAAMLWGLMEYWALKQAPVNIAKETLALGADVPVCLSCVSTRMRGVGEILSPMQGFPEIPIVLIYPGKPASTARIFARYHNRYKEDLFMPDHFDHADQLCEFLKTTENDLYKAALDEVPEIENAINALRLQSGCMIARMSGSGSACFGLFEDKESAGLACAEIAKANPDWWVKSGFLGRPERY